MSNAANFKAWFVDILESLYPIRNAGIVIFMISFPLLERLLRRKHALGPEAHMTDAAMDGLRAIFPALPTTEQARKFWNVYRNGYLHQATVSTAKAGQPLPAGWLTHDISESVRIEPNGSFTVNPVLFSKTVLAAISAEFVLFETAPDLPQVIRLDPVTIPSSYTGPKP